MSEVGSLMSNKEIIALLEEIDLSSYPYDVVKRLVSQFQPKILILTIPPGVVIERVRPDVDVFERKDVSYRPSKKNEKPQRATLPHKTAFYGTMCHEDDPLYKNRQIVLLESSKLLKGDKYAEGTELYTISRWITNESLKLAVFVHDSIYPEVKYNRLLNMAKEAFLKYKTFIDEPMQFDAYEKYVTEQYAKVVESSKDYDYIISATIADMLMNVSRVDGVMYPSVPALGQFGMNVALRHDVADQKLRLHEVNEIEYKQQNGEGRLSFLRKAIPDVVDSRGLKKWHYTN